MARRVTDPAAFGRVAVLMGGWSAEREVSLSSGRNVLEALRACGVDAHGIDADRQNILRLAECGYTRAFNLLHGVGGEDGTVQAVLDLQKIPYPGCGVLASALGMDKLLCKRLWKAEALPTPDYRLVREPSDALAAAENLGYPLFIKPAADGSSLGVSKVATPDQLACAFAEAYRTGGAVMAEACVAGGEYTCCVLEGHRLPLIQIEPDGEFYDYHAKYQSDNTRYYCPASMNAADADRLQDLCQRAFALLGGEGWGRVDFLLDERSRPWLIEINTLPGMTSHSLLPMAARTAGLDFPELCWAVLETSLPGGESKRGVQ